MWKPTIQARSRVSYLVGCMVKAGATVSGGTALILFWAPAAAGFCGQRGLTFRLMGSGWWLVKLSLTEVSRQAFLFNFPFPPVFKQCISLKPWNANHRMSCITFCLTFVDFCVRYPFRRLLRRLYVHLGRDPFNQNSNRSDREKRTTSKGGPVFPKLFRLDRTDPLSFGPKFPESLVEWVAPLTSSLRPRDPKRIGRDQGTRQRWTIGA